jgi:ABC-type transport system involved in multi-copper enzyme maturation permease subunit
VRPFTRIAAIALNTYREAARARVLLGVFALSLAACLYSLVVATLSLGNEARVVADLGALSLSLFGVVVAVVLGSTSLYRELEYKTIFPILSRPLRRWEYIVGKYVGTLLTVLVFIAVETAAIFAILAIETEQPVWKVGLFAGLSFAAIGLAWVRARAPARVFAVIPWALAVAAAAWFLADTAPAERQLVAASSALSLCEVGIVAALATLFASFSSPFLTAAFTSMIFVIGRSADTLAHFPKRLFGNGCSAAFRWLSHVVPNFHLYVPPRPLLLGNVVGQPVWAYVGMAALHALAYAIALLVVSSLAFAKRDFA